MSTNIVVGIGLLAVLAVVVLVVTVRGPGRGATTGLLSRETEQRDRARRRRSPKAPPRLSGRELERGVALERVGSGDERRGVQRRGLGLLAVDDPHEVDVLAPAMDDEQLGVTRRHFLNIGVLVMFISALGSFGAAVLAFLWPSLSGGFGSKVKVGKLDDILATIASKQEPFYVAEARTYLVPYPKEALDKAKASYSGEVLAGMEAGVVAIYQKCVHLGCKVPWCVSSQWFECPCHGSQYNRVGEKKGGPAPRGLDRFAVSVDDGVVTVNSGALTQGPDIGVNSTGQEAEGPHCVGGA